MFTPKYVKYPLYEGAEKVCVSLNPAPLYLYENKFKNVIKAQYIVKNGHTIIKIPGEMSSLRGKYIKISPFLI